MTTTKLPAGLAILLILLFMSASCFAIEQIPVTGQISDIDYEQQTLKIDILAEDGSDITENEMKLVVDFDSSADNCIDWNNEKNRALSVFFTFESGDIIKAGVLIEEEANKASGLVDISESFNKALTDSGKLFPPSLLETFKTPRTRVNVIISLGMEEKDNESSPSIFEALTEKDFIFEDKAQNTPIISGRASLSGLIKLIKSPDVLSIEENMDMKLLAPTGEIRQ